MKRLLRFFIVLMVSCWLQQHAAAQESPVALSPSVSSRYVERVSDKASKLQKKLTKKSTKVLAKLSRQQDKLKRKLHNIDSLQASAVFGVAEQRYRKLEEQLQHPQQMTQYLPLLDTLKTSLAFLDKNKELIAQTKGLNGKLTESLGKINSLDQQLQKAEQVKRFIKEQRQFLQDKLASFPLARKLKKLNKQAYYYGQQIEEYKQLIRDKKKIERKAIELLSKTKLFQDFMKKNSVLASLFRMPPDDPNSPAYLQSLSGLQTRTQVSQFIQQQTGGGPNAMQQVQGALGQAETQLQQLKDKMLDKIAGGSSDAEIPDFRPNSQRTKTFLHRLEWGANIQSQRSNGIFPVTSDLGLSIGYKLNDHSAVGVGASYKLGWGQSFRKMKITHEGAGIRSFVDYQLKKTFWLSGGFEMNYRTVIEDFDQLKDVDAWQQSGLLGISKKLPIETKFFRGTKLQLFWDFLSYRQVPKSQPIIFRIGYSFK